MLLYFAAKWNIVVPVQSIKSDGFAAFMRDLIFVFLPDFTRLRRLSSTFGLCGLNQNYIKEKEK